MVPGCKSNYHSESGFISVFSFPIDVQIREKWLMCRAFYRVTHKIQLSNYVLNDIRLLEQIIQEVELFEMVKNTNVTSSANPVGLRMSI